MFISGPPGRALRRARPGERAGHAVGEREYEWPACANTSPVARPGLLGVWWICCGGLRLRDGSARQPGCRRTQPGALVCLGPMTSRACTTGRSRNSRSSRGQLTGPPNFARRPDKPRKVSVWLGEYRFISHVSTVGAPFRVPHHRDNAVTGENASSPSQFRRIGPEYCPHREITLELQIADHSGVIDRPIQRSGHASLTMDNAATRENPPRSAKCSPIGPEYRPRHTDDVAARVWGHAAVAGHPASLR
jgi:hypothetical protein